MEMDAHDECTWRVTPYHSDVERQSGGGCVWRVTAQARSRERERLACERTHMPCQARAMSHARLEPCCDVACDLGVLWDPEYARSASASGELRLCESSSKVSLL